MIARINHVAIISHQYPILGKFYQSLYGMKPGDSPPESAVSYGDGNVGLQILPRRDGYIAGLDHFGMLVDDIAEVERRLRKYDGANMVKRPSSRPFAAYIANDPDVGPGLKLMPIVGFRYLEVTEGLFQTGVFNGGFDGVVDFGEDLNSNGMLDTGEDINNDGLLDLGLVSTIDSRVNNEIYAPQIGFRLQFEHEWFHLGFEPKLALGVNRYEMAVETNQLRSFGDPRTHESRRGSRFAQVADFRFFMKLFPSDNLELFVAYDITVAGGLSRAHDNVYYNDNGQSEPPAIGVDPGFETVWWQGLTVGGQIWLR